MISLEWIRCFSAYIAVISAKQPHRVPDLPGYLTLITEAHVQYAGDGWIGYDRRFRQIAATKLHVTWAQIDTTLWNIAFSGKARLVRCKFCFSIMHTPQNVSGHQTKSLLPQEVSPSSKLQLNQCSPTLAHCGDAEYACCTTVSQLLAVHSLTANSNIFALFVPMIHMPLISTQGGDVSTPLYPFVQQRAINCGISKQLCSLKYVTLNDAILTTLALGPWYFMSNN